MTHLIFADDLTVSVVEPKTQAYLKEAFDKFSVSTGLEANKDKSQIVMGGCNEQLRRQILE